MAMALSLKKILDCIFAKPKRTRCGRGVLASLRGLYHRGGHARGRKKGGYVTLAVRGDGRREGLCCASGHAVQACPCTGVLGIVIRCGLCSITSGASRDGNVAVSSAR